MPDYKEMYFTLFRATEKAIRELVAAQRQCEEQYLSASCEVPSEIAQNTAGTSGENE